MAHEGDVTLEQFAHAADILDVLARPGHYAEIVMGIREKFRRLHSPEARMRELLQLIEE